MTARLKKLIGMAAAGALVWGCAGAARADSELRQALSQVPGRMMLSKGGFPAIFVSLNGLRTVAGPDLTGQIGLRLRIGEGDALRAYFMSSGESWQEHTGIGRSDLATFTTYGVEPATVTIWRFADAAKTQTLVAGLASRGFKQENGVWSNGVPLEFNRDRIDPKNPFAGGLGRASMLVAVKGGIAQSPEPRAAAEAGALKAEESLAATVPVGASLDAIEAAIGKGVVVQALVLSPNVWSLAADPADLLLASPGQDLKKLAEKLAEKTKQPRVPPTIGAILADVEMGAPGGRGAVLALPYNDCATAEQAGKIFGDRWKSAAGRDGKSAAEWISALPTITTKPAKGLCVLSVSIVQPPEDGVSNRVFAYIVMSINNRDFQPL